jgi:hemolysin activation/secretion protein
MFKTHTPFSPIFMVVTVALLFPIAAQAVEQPAAPERPPMPAATGATATFPIRGFELKGDMPLSSDETTRILAPFIRADGNLETLQKAGAALEAALKERGYALHRVGLPPQEVGNKVTFNVIKFVIGKVKIEGQGAFTDANIRASVPEVKEGEAPNFRILAVQTAIANESPAKQIQVSLKESEEAEKIDVKLLMKAGDPVSFAASWANTGSAASGTDRLSLIASHANLFDQDHQLSAAYTTSLERADNVKQLGLNYKIPLYVYGGVVGASYTNSNVVGDNGSFKTTGAGQTYGVNYSYYLPPAGGRRTYLTVGLDEKIFNATAISGQVRPVTQPESITSRPITLGYTAKVEADAAAWGYNAELAFNVPGGSGTSLNDYQFAASGVRDPRISTVNWSVLRGGVNYLGDFNGGWLWTAKAQFQYSADGLISGEQFGLGGASSVRGVEERVMSGDSGLLGTLEVTSKEFYPGLRGVGFLDAGSLTSNNNAAIASNQLASVGLGLRYNTGKISVSTDWAQVITAADPLTPTPQGSHPPQTGDGKLHVNLTARF